jgi:hypothetical protein
MFYQTEEKAQGWRAMARFDDGREALVFLGRSNSNVRQGYEEAYKELFDDEEKEQITGIILQRWHGAPDAGCWELVTTLKVPGQKLARISA